MTEPSPVVLPVVSNELADSQPQRRYNNPLGWYNLGYFSDLLYLILVMALGFWFDQMEPFQRPIDDLVLNDTDLKHPHLKNIVTSTMLWIYAVAVPSCIGLVFFVASWALGRLKTYDAAFSLHLFILSLFLSLAITGFVTNVLKIWGGRFRPDFLDRCQYNSVTKACTGDADLVMDGRRSWPSGHSSLCFSGLGFLGMWLYGLVLDGSYIINDQLKVNRKWGYLQSRPGRAWRFILPFAPWLWAAYVAISRTQQYIHHPTDVLSGACLLLIMIGAIIGFVIAAVIYFGYFKRHELKSFNIYEAI